MTVAERFWPKVDTSAGLFGCWPWTAGTFHNGYGQFWVGGAKRLTGAHRVAYELAVGPISPGHFVCHTCDTPLCCNPAHLFVGTGTENIADRHLKARDARGEQNGARRHPERLARGERNAAARLTTGDVAELRRRGARRHGDLSRLAREFSVDRSTIARAISGQTWRHVA